MIHIQRIFTEMSYLVYNNNKGGRRAGTPETDILHKCSPYNTQFRQTMHTMA